MPTLENINGASLVPDIMGSVSQGYALGSRMRQDQMLLEEYKKKQAQQERNIALRSKVLAGGHDAFQSYQELASQDPEAAQQLVSGIKGQYDASDEMTKSTIQRRAMDALMLSHINDPKARKEVLNGMISSYSKIGVPTDDYKLLSALNDSGNMAELEGHLNTQIAMGEAAGIFGQGQDMTADQKNYQMLQQMPPGAERDAFANMVGANVSGAQGDPRLKGAPTGTMWVDPNDPSKGVSQIKGVTQKTAVPSEGERKSAVLLKRMEGSLSQLQNAVTTASGKNEDVSKPGVLPTALRTVGLESAANYITPENRQRVDSAQLDILDAALTLGTGAAYTKEQLEGYRKSYFPQIGDDPKTVEDKQARLNNVIEAARIAAGRANQPSDDPALQAYADQFFGGDIEAAKRHNQ